MATVQDHPVAQPKHVKEPQHPFFQHDPVARLADLQFQLEPVQHLCTELADELQQLTAKENAARELLKLTEGLPEHGYEHRRAGEVLARLADERHTAEDRLSRAKKMVAAIQEQIGQLDKTRLERLRKIHQLSVQLGPR